MNFKNKVALVTGGSSGIGQSICIALSNAGVKVVFTYNTSEEGAETTLQNLNTHSRKIKADMHSKSDIESLFNVIEKEYGKLDILVNNSGINSPRGLFKVEDWKEIFEVDLFSVVSVTGKAVELMKNGGKILNVTSMYGDGKVCDKGIAPYGAAKAALNHYTHMLAKNLAPKILVNAIAPGYVRTPLWGDKPEEEFISAGKEQLIERMISSDEIAEMSLAIIKNDAITGEIAVVDGGLSLKTV